MANIGRLAEKINMGGDEKFDAIFQSWQTLQKKLIDEKKFLCAMRKAQTDPSFFWQIVIIRNPDLNLHFQEFIYSFLTIAFSSSAVESGFSGMILN